MKYFILLCLMCLSTLASPAKTPSRDEVKVISYNIRFVNKKDYAPDVFGVQEALFSQLEYLDEKLPHSTPGAKVHQSLTIYIIPASLNVPNMRR